jgi:predicted DNA-binding transcriptional regulator AlpA
MRPAQTRQKATANTAASITNACSKLRPDVSHFDKLPDAALIAIKALAAVLGKGVSTAWRDIKSDPDFPQPIRLGAGCTRFKVGDIRAYLTKKSSASARSTSVQRPKGKVAL